MTCECGSCVVSKNCEILLFLTTDRCFDTKVKCPTKRTSFWVKFPTVRSSTRVKCPGGRGGGMGSLRIDWYIRSSCNLSIHSLFWTPWICLHYPQQQCLLSNIIYANQKPSPPIAHFFCLIIWFRRLRAHTKPSTGLQILSESCRGSLVMKSIFRNCARCYFTSAKKWNWVQNSEIECKMVKLKMTDSSDKIELGQEAPG